MFDDGVELFDITGSRRRSYVYRHHIWQLTNVATLGAIPLNPCSFRTKGVCEDTLLSKRERRQDPNYHTVPTLQREESSRLTMPVVSDSEDRMN
jgi:hypothetical protein